MKVFTLHLHRFGEKIVQMWITGRDSYPHSPLQASFSPRSDHIVNIGYYSIVGIDLDCANVVLALILYP